jgi:hypothetical protein
VIDRQGVDPAGLDPVSKRHPVGPIPPGNTVRCDVADAGELASDHKSTLELDGAPDVAIGYRQTETVPPKLVPEYGADCSRTEGT